MTSLPLPEGGHAHSLYAEMLLNSPDKAELIDWLQEHLPEATRVILICGSPSKDDAGVSPSMLYSTGLAIILNWTDSSIT